MIYPILFRGGMFGDLLIGMLDQRSLISKTYWGKEYRHSRCADKYIKYTRTYLKKFFKYTDKERIRYYELFKKIKDPVYFLTHDTDFSMKYYKEETIQIVCSDITLFNYFAERFYKLHKQHVINETKQIIKNTDNFIEDYKKSLILWQKSFIFPRQFDIKNIMNKFLFLKDLQYFFSMNKENLKWAEYIYTKHFEQNFQLKRNLVIDGIE